MEKLVSLKEKIAVFLEMIQFKLTVFALPFAFCGAFLAARGIPEVIQIFYIIIAMVGARTSAMAFNRVVDRKFDAANPRTASRAIPAGDIKLSETWAVIAVSAAAFFFACYSLNSLTFLLSPLALGLTFFYSLTKRFTALCHLVLGVALAFSPLGGWVAVQGSLSGYPYVLSLSVIFWVAGFDVIYGCMDAEFDRKAGLHSLPALLGKSNGFKLAGFFHIVAFTLFCITGYVSQLNFVYYIGIGLAAIAFIYQHTLVRPDDLSKIHASFFLMNGIISITVFLSTWVSLATLG